MSVRFRNVFLRLLVRIRRYFQLRTDTDEENTIKSINTSVPLRGSNIWYLICSAILASIGLDVNSPAVVIGAMLISPLMFPILGIGLGFGIHDRENIVISIREFSAAVSISLLTSMIYFLISPLGAATSEILARTKPTILDVGVAFFGGVAGIVAGSRTKAANAIPGVAIATALMPPICTAGFGFAHWNINIILGALYLFFINTVFIALSVYLIVRFLKFPYKEYPDNRTKSRMRKIVFSIVVLVTIPSIVIFYGIIVEARTNQKINRFINREIASDKVNILRWNLVEKGDSGLVKVLIAGDPCSDGKIDTLKRKMISYSIYNMDLNIIQVGLLDKNSKDFTQNLLIEIAQLNETVSLNSRKIDTLTGALNYYREDSLKFQATIGGIKELFPVIENLSYSRYYSIQPGDSAKAVYYPAITIEWVNNPRRSVKRDYLQKLETYYKNVLSADSVLIIESR